MAALSLGVSAAAAQSLPEMRMTPAEIRASALDSNPIGSSAVPGVHTKVIFGDPAKAGFYTILLFVPPHNTIQAHAHRDHRVARCRLRRVALCQRQSFRCKIAKDIAAWKCLFGAGRRQPFRPGDNDAVVVEVSGYGPHYFEAANDPRSPEKK